MTASEQNAALENSFYAQTTSCLEPANSSFPAYLQYKAKHYYLVRQQNHEIVKNYWVAHSHGLAAGKFQETYLQ